MAGGSERTQSDSCYSSRDNSSTNSDPPRLALPSAPSYDTTSLSSLGILFNQTLVFLF